MQDENTNADVAQDRTFGEIAERDGEAPQEPVLVEDKVKAKTEEVETKEGKTEDVKTDEVKDETKDETKKEELTELGTKKDPNPQSAIHQELANERKIRSQMEKVLADPKLLVEFAKKQGYDLSLAEAKEVVEDQKTDSTVKEFTAEDFESTEDVAKVVNTLQKQFAEAQTAKDKKIVELEGKLEALAGDSYNAKVVNNVEKGVTELSQLDELNPKSENFIEGLEAKIVQKYKDLDYDEETGKFRGKYNIADIGKEFVEIAKMNAKKVSLNTQTIIKDKSRGKIQTSEKVNDEPSTDDLTPGDSIALGISKMFKNR